PLCSIWVIVVRSTPAAPRFSRTFSHARSSTSLRWMRSESAWNRRAGDRLAARYSLTWRSRTLSCSVLLAPEGMHQSFPRQQARMKQGSFPSPPVLLSARLKRYHKPLRHPPSQTRLHGTSAYTPPSLPRHAAAG